MHQITYTKQADGTFLKEGSFPAAPAEVRIACGNQPASGSAYTLARAQEIIEEAIAKQQVKHDKYAIVATEENIAEAEVKAEKAAKKVKVPKAPKAPKEPVAVGSETAQATEPAEVGSETVPAETGPKFPNREARITEATARGISELEVYVEACVKFGRTPAPSAQAKYDALIAKRAAKTVEAPAAA
jgi:hypothetical protein